MENQLETCHLISLAYEIPVTVHDIMVFAVSISHYGTYKCLLKFMVWFIKKNPTRCNHVPKFYYSIFIRSSTCFGQHTPIIKGIKLQWQPLVFHMWKVVGRVVGGWKTRGCQCSFRPLMMGSLSPKTCWASYKYGIIRFWYIVASCWNFFMNSEDLFAKRYTMQASNVVYISVTKIWDTLWTGIARNRSCF